MTKIIKHILFDLDGTLVDSSLGIKSAFAYAFDRLPLILPDDDTLSSFIGPPLEVTFASYFEQQSEVGRAISYFREYYQSKGVHQVELYPHIIELLAYLRVKGYDLYVTTSKHEPMAKLILEEQGIDIFFKGVYGATEERHHKTDVITACLQEEAISKEEAIIIGDTPFDILGGQKVGIKTLAITWGFGLLKDLQNCQPNYSCSSYQDIKKLF